MAVKGPRVVKNPRLTPRMEAFAREWVIDLCGTRAATRAGYKGTGHALEVQASQLLRRPQVKALIDAVMKERAEKVGRTAEQVIERLWRLADKAESDEDWSAAKGCLELLGKHHGLFVDRVSHEGGVVVEIINPYSRPVSIDVQFDRVAQKPALAPPELQQQPALVSPTADA